MQDPIKSNPFTPTYKKDIVWAGLNGSRFINDPLRLFPSLLGRLCTRLVLCNNASVAAAGADGPAVVVVEGLAEAGAAPPKLNPTLGAASLPLDDVEKENPAGGLVVAAGAPKLKAIVCLAFLPALS